jgi:hypothetical protein
MPVTQNEPESAVMPLFVSRKLCGEWPRKKAIRSRRRIRHAAVAKPNQKRNSGEVKNKQQVFSSITSLDLAFKGTALREF